MHVSVFHSLGSRSLERASHSELKRSNAWPYALLLHPAPRCLHAGEGEARSVEARVQH